MATSIIPKQASEPEFVTQVVKGYARIKYLRAAEISMQEANNISGVSMSISGRTLSSVTFNVAKSGYTLVGISYATSQYRGDLNISGITRFLAGFAQGSGWATENGYAARIAVSGNNLVLTPSDTSAVQGDEWKTITVTVPTSGYEFVYLGKIICKYIKI